MSTINSYEVIRIINSRPLFLNDHFSRFENTLNSVDANIKVDNISFGSLLYKTIKERCIENGNIKIEALYNTESQTLEYKCNEIPHHYPSSKQYELGVETKTFAYERQNPHSKIWNQNLRDTVDKFISDNNIFEAIYVNLDNKITEGTRSNIFFITNKELISAPEKDILKGVTRKYIIETAKRNGFELVERNIDIKDLPSFESAFISGTSPKILPISKINDQKFSVENENLRLLMQKFNEIINQNIG